ncbi:cupin domain-containing protein [Roseiconus nitratireducens]|uniref:Cupin domain-containing protein n=1 Tax=Roseiconus nitratireducens TaxID=2605748 RepID=A0A5M6D2S6_9BACT|nr:cupin domain-containing protein [Roseiconus nitratireducens]KAA5539445.1 cupin domain-containing protein [Roseiconus nitratireducens]
MLETNMDNYSTFNAGPWSEMANHVFELGSLRGSGKLFLSERLNSDGAEISLNRIEAGQSVPFLHRHSEHEEIYIVVSGQGEFWIDEQCLPLVEGTAVRVAPAGVRCLRASKQQALNFICVQAVSGTLKSRNVSDGQLVAGTPVWN